MLYSPAWTKAKADVFTLASLIAWLETMPPNGEYDFYCKTGKCLLDQYLASHGLPGFSSHYLNDDHVGLRNYHRLALLDDVVSDIAINVGHDIANSAPMTFGIANSVPKTFGAALTRARAFAAA